MSECIDADDTPEFEDLDTAEHSGATLQRRYENHIGYQLMGGHGKDLICLCITRQACYSKDHCWHCIDVEHRKSGARSHKPLGEELCIYEARLSCIIFAALNR